MARMGRFAMALCVFSMVANAQEDPLAWFPLQVGSRWVYEHEWKSVNRTGQSWTGGPPRKRSPGGDNSGRCCVLREVKQQGNLPGKTITNRVIDPNGQLRYVEHQGNNHSAHLIAP